MSANRRDTKNYNYTSEKLQGVILLGDIVEALASLGDDTGFPFQLDWHPVRPGSFSIPEAGIGDNREGVLVGPNGKVGRIDYRTGSGMIQATPALALRERWAATFEYDPLGAVAEVGESIQLVSTVIGGPRRMKAEDSHAPSDPGQDAPR